MYRASRTVAVALIGVVFAAGRVRAETERSGWATMKVDGGVTIYYAPALAADAEKAKAYLGEAVRSLSEEFEAHDPRTIPTRIDCHFYLHPEPNDQAAESSSNCITKYLAGGKVYAELHFLTPGRVRPESMNSAGEPRGADHTFFRYIVHEYGSIWLGLIVRDKAKGWRTNGKDAPNWFWQGYQEYLGMTRSSLHSRSVTFGKYMAIVQADPDRVMVGYGYKDKVPRIIVRNDYIDGFAVVAFMHERFGKRAVQGILTSEAETFGEAMREAVGMNTGQFYETFQRWLETWESPDERPTPR